jgi:hypothetical protein
MWCWPLLYLFGCRAFGRLLSRTTSPRLTFPPGCSCEIAFSSSDCSTIPQIICGWFLAERLARPAHCLLKTHLSSIGNPHCNEEKIMKRIVTVTILFAAAVGLIGSSALAVEPAGNLTKSEVRVLIQTAKTPADHAKLANYYRYEATRLQAEVKDHEAMAAAYDKNPMGHPIPKPA